MCKYILFFLLILYEKSYFIYQCLKKTNALQIYPFQIIVSLYIIIYIHDDNVYKQYLPLSHLGDYIIFIYKIQIPLTH